MLSDEEINNRTKWHSPSTHKVEESHSTVRYNTNQLIKLFRDVVPSGREQSVAITKLEEAMMWANAGIARNQ